jgi:leucyl-tRNA synthetase
LQDLKSSKREILEPLLVTLAPFAPHITEELWSALGHQDSIAYARFPAYDESILVENTFIYPVSVNGKLRTEIEFSLDISTNEMQSVVLGNDIVKKWLDGKDPKKVIIVPRKIVNVVV